MPIFKSPFSTAYWRTAARELKNYRSLVFSALMVAACIVLSHCKIPLGENLSLSVTFLARALCATDSLLLLDEPVTGLDPETTAEMYEIIRNINRQGVAIVTVSHDVGQALRDAKHVLVMERTVRFYGETEAYEAWRRENG